jgi:ankyrin repeat protein
MMSVFENLRLGETAARGMWPNGATLLHVAAEYAFMDAAKLLIDHGADVNHGSEADRRCHAPRDGGTLCPD